MPLMFWVAQTCVLEAAHKVGSLLMHGQLNSGVQDQRASSCQVQLRCKDLSHVGSLSQPESLIRALTALQATPSHSGSLDDIQCRP